jgi:hypothetical protein
METTSAAGFLWAAGLGALLYLVLLRLRFGNRAWLILAALLSTAGLVAAAAWGAAWLHLRLRPIYQVLYVQPDPVRGWRGVPGLDYPSTGTYGEFLVRVRHNSLGFRDLERTEDAPPGVRRVALLGDSFVEAIQVPLEETAGQLLEAGLNRAASGGGRWEVLNFGVSNYGLGQYLLTWRQVARRYRPEVVAIFVAGFQFDRTLEQSPRWQVLSPDGAPRRIRPVFRLEGETLVQVPAPDAAVYQELYRSRILGRLGGRLVWPMTPWQEVGGFWRGLLDQAAGRHVVPAYNLPGVSWEEVTVVNLLVLEELWREVSASGARLMVADANPFLPTSREIFTLALQSFCRRRGVVYADLAAALREAVEQGETVTWPQDGHFTPAGHRVFAGLLLRHLAASPSPP